MTMVVRAAYTRIEALKTGFSCLGGIDNLSAAVAMREDVYKRTRQIFGPLHPKTQRRQRSLEVFRAALADIQAGRPAIIQFTSNNI